MKIGITYDLRQDYLDQGYGEEETAEFDRLSTIEAIDETLQSLGHQTERIGNIWNLTKKLAQNQRWELVFNIAEGLYGIGREAQVPALLDAYQIPYTFSDPLILALTLQKAMTKRVLRDLGIATPDFAEISKADEIKNITLAFPLFAKPVAEGTGKGINATSKIKNRQELETVVTHLLKKYNQPVLVERFLPGREFTVGIVGTGNKARSIGIMEVILKEQAEAEVYSYVNKENCEELIEYRKGEDALARETEVVALAAWRGLGCRDGGRVDLRTDDKGLPNIIELNPLAGIHPEHSDLPIICSLHGISYQVLLKMIVESASERVIFQHGIDDKRAD
ncbi:MAG: ATP-grasp domain-containing protein [Deltaproteobacteria bacterium]|nr:ATP-grasp domain-containing protein [Deltaproteobacteria bacterium]